MAGWYGLRFKSAWMVLDVAANDIDSNGNQRIPLTVRNWKDLPDANVDVKTVALMTGRSVPSIWPAVAQGRLPQPRRFTHRCSRWSVGVTRVHLRGAQ